MIDDELSFFEEVYQTLISENPKLKNEDLNVFLRVQGEISSGNGMYQIKNSKIKKANKKTWNHIESYLKNLNVSSVNDLITFDQIEHYIVEI